MNETSRVSDPLSQAEAAESARPVILGQIEGLIQKNVVADFVQNCGNDETFETDDQILKIRRCFEIIVRLVSGQKGSHAPDGGRTSNLSMIETLNMSGIVKAFVKKAREDDSFASINNVQQVLKVLQYCFKKNQEAQPPQAEQPDEQTAVQITTTAIEGALEETELKDPFPESETPAGPDPQDEETGPELPQAIQKLVAAFGETFDRTLRPRFAEKLRELCAQHEVKLGAYEPGYAGKEFNAPHMVLLLQKEPGNWRMAIVYDTEANEVLLFENKGDKQAQQWDPEKWQVSDTTDPGSDDTQDSGETAVKTFRMPGAGKGYPLR